MILLIIKMDILNLVEMRKNAYDFIKHVQKRSDYNGHIVIFFHELVKKYDFALIDEFNQQKQKFIINGLNYKQQYGDVYECEGVKYKVKYHQFAEDDEFSLLSPNTIRMSMGFKVRHLGGLFVYVELEEISNKKYNKYENKYNLKCGFETCFASGCMKICSRCKKIRYCSREHQKSDWKQHKKICGK